MNLRLDWIGLTEFEAALKALPAELTAEAATIAEAAANDAAAEMRAAYPKRTGTLATSVQVTAARPNAYATRFIVTNTAKHAYLFDIGTQARHNAIGANRGSMPAGNVFIPTMIRHRRAMYTDDRAMLEHQGLRVSGEA